MHLVRVGNLTISLEYLALTEDSEGEPEPKSLPRGSYRMTLGAGRVVELYGDRADLARRFVDEVTIKRPGGEPRLGTQGRELHEEEISAVGAPPSCEREKPDRGVGQELGDRDDTETVTARGA